MNTIDRRTGTSRLADRLPVFNATEVSARLGKTELKTALREAFAALARGEAVQPAQTLALLPGHAGDYILYSAALSEPALFGVKISPYLTARAKAGLSPVTAYTILFSSLTGEPVTICDSLALTTQRTAATTSLAIDLMAPARTDTLAVIGSGPVALAHLDYELASRDWQRVLVFSPRLDADASRKADLLARFPQAAVVTTAQQAVEDADVAMLCTSSGTKVIESEWLRPDAIVTSISTNVARAHEIDPATLSSYAVLCDYRATTPLQAGEMVIAAEAHGWSLDRVVADLPELAAGRISAPSDGRRFFRSIGLGLVDVVAARLVMNGA